MIDFAFTPIIHNTTNSINDASSSSKSAHSNCENIVQKDQTLGGYLWPRTVAYYTNEQIKKDRTSQISLSFLQKGRLGVTMGLKQFLPLIFMQKFIVMPLLNRTLDALGFPSEINDASQDVCEYGFGRIGIIGPFIEEIIFRGILQNSLSSAQKMMRFYMPVCLRGRITDWVTSSQARVLAVNGLFGLIHLRNGGGYLSSRAAIRQAITHMIFSQESALYETTDSLIAPFAAHVTNNTLAYFIACSLKNHIKQ